MDENRLRYLYQRFNDRTATNAEVDEYYNALSAPGFEQVVKSIIDHTWDTMGPEHSLQVSEESADRIYASVISVPKPVEKSKSLWARIAIAATIATIVVGIGLYYFNNFSHTLQTQTAYQNDIAPGNQGATLILANGKKIDLSRSANQELAREAGVIITKTSDGKLVYQLTDQNPAQSNMINTLSTANGQTYQLRLPDGTRVWLNAESSISYPASFVGLKQRTVQLKGEAYWEVAKDKTHPFIVQTEDRQEVQVLGTHFNIYAYEGEPIKTALVEGSVKVSVGAQSKMIVPGQQTVVANDLISVQHAELEETLAWKDGDFDFDNKPISEIMTVLARWYNIEVSYQPDFKESRLTGRISRNRNFSQVIKMLSQTKKVHFKIEGRRVSVMP